MCVCQWMLIGDTRSDLKKSNDNNSSLVILMEQEDEAVEVKEENNFLDTPHRWKQRSSRQSEKQFPAAQPCPSPTDGATV